MAADGPFPPAVCSYSETCRGGNVHPDLAEKVGWSHTMGGNQGRFQSIGEKSRAAPRRITTGNFQSCLAAELSLLPTKRLPPESHGMHPTGGPVPN